MKFLLIQESTPIFLPNKADVIKIVLYTKYIQNSKSPFENDLNILAELFEYGCYSNKKEQGEFFDILLQKKLRNSIPSARNKISEFIDDGILERPHRNAIRFNSEFLPSLTSTPEKVAFISRITHAK